MKVQVQYAAQLRDLTGCPEESFEVKKGSRTIDLVQAIAERHGRQIEPILYSDGRIPSKSLLCFVGGRSVQWEQKLREHDEVLLMTPMAGG